MGVSSARGPGYRWQPYTPLAWPQLRTSDSALQDVIAATRRHWQSLGVLSSRRWPAQIIVSESGTPGAVDWLQADIVSAEHPDGSPIETHVLSSTRGASRVRERLRRRGLEKRIHVLDCSSPEHPERLDLRRLPQLLRRELDLRIVNHDGGRTLHRAFVQAGILAQLQLTLMRGVSVRDLVVVAPVEERLRSGWLAQFSGRAQRYFSDGLEWWTHVRPLQVLVDGGDTVVIALDLRTLPDL